MTDEKRKKIEEVSRQVAERLKTPEARARREEAVKRSKERARKIMESGNITEEFLRRRVTI